MTLGAIEHCAERKKIFEERLPRARSSALDPHQTGSYFGILYVKTLSGLDALPIGQQQETGASDVPACSLLETRKCQRARKLSGDWENSDAPPRNGGSYNR